MNITILNERPNDYRHMEEIAREAFWNLYFPGCHEHYVVHQMRNHPDFISELSFVVEADGQVVGGIYYTNSAIVQPDGSEVRIITFGPVCILPKYHRMGLGRRIITHSIKKAKEMGYRGILTLGYPYHYIPYGFVGGKRYGISMEDGKFYTGLLALPLYDGAFDDVSGWAKFSTALDSIQEAVDEFDSTFPPKEKAVTPSQVEFEKAVSQLDATEY
ncbi:MAG: N-acetyltransferase [Rikenellaceae bacterium]